MPVVSEDWKTPSDWARFKTVWSLVEDGEMLRSCRRSSVGPESFHVCPVDEWMKGSDLRKKFDQDVKQGARVVVGLEPHRVMVRELQSPLTDRRKADDVWESLLDTVIPFQLESCQVVFSKPESASENGWFCVAAAIRNSDLDEALDAWNTKGVDPHLMLVEGLVLTSDRIPRVWRGEQRAVLAAWQDGRFTGMVGAVSPRQHETLVPRFLASFPNEDFTSPLEECGPGADAKPTELEHRLALAASGGSTCQLNLRAGERAHPRLAKEYAGKQRSVLAAALLLAALLVAIPPASKAFFRHQHRTLRQEISQEAQRFTGQPAPDGQELLVSERFVEKAWTPVDLRAESVLGPDAADVLALLLTQAGELGLPVRSVQIGSDTYRMVVPGAQSTVRRLADSLQSEIWQVEIERESPGLWRLQGVQSP